MVKWKSYVDPKIMRLNSLRNDLPDKVTVHLIRRIINNYKTYYLMEELV